MSSEVGEPGLPPHRGHGWSPAPPAPNQTPLPPPQPPPSRRGSTVAGVEAAGETDLQRDRQDWKQNLKRAWPAILLAAVLAFLDFRLRGQPFFAIVAFSLAVTPFALRHTVGSRLSKVTGKIPAKIRPIVVAGLPIAIFYLFRWRGTQSWGLALITVAVPLILGLWLSASRPLLHRSIGAFYRGRNKVLPRVARVLIAIAFPIVFAFTVIHRSPQDIPAFFGFPTSNPQTPVGLTQGLLVVLGAAASTTVAFFLLDERSRSSREVVPS